MGFLPLFIAQVETDRKRGEIDIQQSLSGAGSGAWVHGLPGIHLLSRHLKLHNSV